MYQLFQINKIVLFVFLFVFLGALDLTAQNRQLDSLEQLLKVHAEKDSARLDLLLKICWIYTTTDYKKIANHLEEISSLRMSLPKNKLYPRVDIIYGYYYKSIGEFGKSYQSFEDALEYYEGARDTLNMIRSLYRLGELSNNTHNLVRSFSSRRAYYDQASELLKYFRNDEQSIFINNGLATLLANEGKFGEALLSLQKSKLIYDTIQFREKPRSMGFYYYQLGRCYFNVKNYSECIKYLAKAENIANELNNKDLSGSE
jgi:tetratricopeptide (TPR) repeat protein